MPETNNTTVRWGILSTAAIAENSYVPAIQASRNGQLQAVCSRDKAKAAAFAQKHGIPTSYGSYQELLNDPQVDAVYNPLPISLHAEWTIKALEAGKPVLCEKPFALSAAEARVMAAKAEETGLPLAEAVMYRRHPLTRKVRELLKDGAIGDLKAIETNFHGVNEEDPETNIRFNKDLGGGAMLDLGIYCVNLARFLTGEEPETIIATGMIHEKSGVDETVGGALRFPSGVVASFSCSMRTHFECTYRLTGTTGRMSVMRGGMVAWPGEKFKILLETGEGSREVVVEEANHYQLMAEHFADAVSGRTKLDYPPEDAVNNMAVIDEVLHQVGAR